MSLLSGMPLLTTTKNPFPCGYPVLLQLIPTNSTRADLATEWKAGDGHYNPPVVRWRAVLLKQAPVVVGLVCLPHIQEPRIRLQGKQHRASLYVKRLGYEGCNKYYAESALARVQCNYHHTGPIWVVQRWCTLQFWGLWCKNPPSLCAAFYF